MNDIKNTNTSNRTDITNRTNINSTLGISSAHSTSCFTGKWFHEVNQSTGTAISLEINELLHSEKTAYQHIDIYQTTTFGNLMVIDNCIMLSQRDHFLYHEMMSHTAMFTHPKPENVAIIGGGDCGTLKEVLKHQSILAAYQVEIDERVTQLSEQFFPELCSANSDPRAEFLFEDGIEWVKSQPANSFDIIIIDSTDPIGPAAGLFERSFLHQCYQILKPDGILIQQSESPLLHTHNIIRNLHINLKSAAFKSVLTLPFPQPVYPSGWWSATMASKQRTDLRLFREDQDQPAIFTEYYNASTHKAALAQPEFMRKAFD